MITEKNKRIYYGLWWSGTYEEAAQGQIRQLITEFQSVHPHAMDDFTGISIHDREDGFRYFIGSETYHQVLQELSLHEGRYWEYRVDKDEDLIEAYNKVEIQIALDDSLKLYDVDGSNDSLPLKVEHYEQSTDALRIVKIEIPLR